MSTQQMLPKLFIQMSGAPGSGKSTTARLLRNSIDGVVIDHDILRSTMLESAVGFDQAAKLAYDLQWALAQDIMRQGLSVIIDSTCNFQEVLDKGSVYAKQHGYAYWYVECKVEDIDELDRRLRTRDRMASQRSSVDQPPAAAVAARGGEENPRARFKKWIESPCRPKDNVIIVDSTGDMDTLQDCILKQIVGFGGCGGIVDSSL
ncbi:P-loop containing nucleoside triphosphate hydrolase protein [Emericellopsis atlantica]|uniref:P-loop containing nucleoside triphosphate hydrolase protein n=1 Tax=Emericellopsis atlantica TaxID=2614577 RepID=A0A9P8CUM2_9HYPO|nr:P-loop containing nucleoside triphosphate hydrolase protein [Emericellopsis atlantica]KAG9257701.1 P-loop containing nucleoside triphosphate hydrolase protein [Emericellopsis atlantica]